MYKKLKKGSGCQEGTDWLTQDENGVVFTKSTPQTMTSLQRLLNEGRDSSSKHVNSAVTACGNKDTPGIYIWHQHFVKGRNIWAACSGIITSRWTSLPHSGRQADRIRGVWGSFYSFHDTKCFCNISNGSVLQRSIPSSLSHQSDGASVPKYRSPKLPWEKKETFKFRFPHGDNWVTDQSRCRRLPSGAVERPYQPNVASG